VTRVLVTNDDGIDAPGLAALARCAVKLGYETVVAAPAEQASGTGAGMSAVIEDGKLIVRPASLPGLADVPAYALQAHPALIALVGCHGAFGGRPDIVLSGVNHGPNLGRAVLHSGTVGAALTAGMHGVSAVAVSLGVEESDDDEPRWATAETVVTGLLPAVLDLPAGSILNVNVPNVAAADLLPLRWATLSRSGRAEVGVNHADDGTIELRTVFVPGKRAAGTDATLLTEGHATITALRSVGEHDELMTSELARSVGALSLG
jgi:5'-nucleotidase